MRLEGLLRGAHPLLVMLPLAAAAYFTAVGMTSLLGAALGTPAWDARSAPPRFVRARVSSADAVLARNPFDSVTGPLGSKPSEALVPAPRAVVPIAGDPLRVAECDGITALIVTEAPDRLVSVAALRSAGDPRPRQRRVGDVLGDKTVEYIGFNTVENSPAVWLSERGVLCQTLLFSPPPLPAVAAPPPAASAAPPARARASGVPAEIASKIQRVSEHEFRIDRAVIDSVLERQAELMGSLRVVPAHGPEGSGFHLFGVRSGTLLDLLGIRNGDTIASINGLRLGTPEQALEAFARLRVAPSLHVALVRPSGPTSIDYEIR